MDQQVLYLKNVHKQVKSAKQMEVYRNRFVREISDLIRYAWYSNTITNKESAELKKYLKDVYSYDNLCGIKQLSIFDIIENNE